MSTSVDNTGRFHQNNWKIGSY